jgi:hypothetical protein
MAGWMAGWMGWVGWGGTGTGTGRESIVMFIVFMVFVQLVLLNMLIAIMGDSVQTVNAQKSAAGLHAKCELIMDCWCERDKRIHINILCAILSQEESSFTKTGSGPT